MASPTIVAVYDANVLYPAPLRDFLMHVAAARLVRAHWTDTIHEEWIRNLLKNRKDLTAEQLARTRALMDRAIPDALVTGYEHRIEALRLSDPDDRHVVAAAQEAGADVIVTFNLKDFPEEALAPLGLAAISPDAFSLSVMEASGAGIAAAARRQRASLKNPPKLVAEYLQTLADNGLPQTSERLAAYAGEL